MPLAPRKLLKQSLQPYLFRRVRLDLFLEIPLGRQYRAVEECYTSPRMNGVSIIALSVWTARAARPPVQSYIKRCVNY